MKKKHRKLNTLRYMLMALLWNRKDKLGRDFRFGDIVNSAIPEVNDEGDVSKTHSEYTFKPFLPHNSITDYQGLYPDLDRPEHERRTVWISKAQSSKKFSHVLDGLIAQRDEHKRRRNQRRLLLEKQFPRKNSRLSSLSSNSSGGSKLEEDVVHHHRHDSFGEGLICPDCKREFGSIEALQRHANEVHHHNFICPVIMEEEEEEKVTSPKVSSPTSPTKKKTGWRERLRLGFYS